MSHKFLAVLTVPSAALGDLLAYAKLHDIDVGDVDLIPPEQEAKPEKKPRRKSAVQHTVRCRDFLRDWVYSHVPEGKVTTARSMREACRSEGYRDGAYDTAVRHLVDDGALKKLGYGEYRRTHQQSIAAAAGHELSILEAAE